MKWLIGNTTLTENVKTGPAIAKNQVSTLTVENPSVDNVYTCVIRSNTYNADQTYPDKVNLDVYGWYLG